MRFRRNRGYGYRDIRFADDDYAYVANTIKDVRNVLDKANRVIPAAAGQMMVIESKIKHGNYMEAARMMAELVKTVQQCGDKLNHDFSSLSRAASLPSVLADLAKR